MPSRVHAKMLINALERAESVVKDLFMEATDDGIEALEAVLAACCREDLEKGPKVAPLPETTSSHPRRRRARRIRRGVGARAPYFLRGA